MKFVRIMLSLFLLLSLDAMAQNWTVGGNNLASNGRIGTNGDADVIFETDNATRGRITSTGLWGFGVNTPTARVHIATPTNRDALRVDVGGNAALLVAENGGTTIGGTQEASPFGLLVAGNAGIGAIPDTYRLKVRHGSFGFDIENSTTMDDWEFFSFSGNLQLYANGEFKGSFDGTDGAYNRVSDERVKTSIQAMPPVLDKVKQLQPSTYQMHQDGFMSDASVRYGFIAQDVEAIFPHLVEHHVAPERDLDAYTMDYSGFGVLAIKAIQELEQNVETLEARILALEATLAKR